MLMGEYHHNIDEKQRLVIPTKYREELGLNFVITRGIEHCLYIYPKDKWDKIVSKLDTLSFTKKDTRLFTRSFFAGAVNSTFDKSGRIIINEIHKKYAGITKECAIIGVGDRLEIWDLASYEALMNETQDALDEISERLFEGTNETF